MSDDPLRGPLDDEDWPTKLRAHVLDPGPPARLRGYALSDDLAQHYSVDETLLLALSGELVSPKLLPVLRAALIMSQDVSVAEAPVHAGIVARLCGAVTSSLIGIVSTALAERLEHRLREHAPLLKVLKNNTPDDPHEAAAAPPDERVALLRRLARRHESPVPGLDRAQHLDAALVCILFAAGLKNMQAMVSLLTAVQLPAALAEALRYRSRAFRKYPGGLPRFTYREDT